ncbi:MAG: hypothetical protein ACI4A3_09865 [Lachnospiraceae bacterium]
MTGIAVSIFLGALVTIAAIALMVLLGVWVYRDAKNKGMNGILWTAVVILVPSCIGLIIYLIVRMDNEKVICSNCNTAVNGKNRFCSNCGVELVPVVDTSEQADAFKKSQRNILIGFFSTLAVIIVLSIFMIASLISGVIGIAGDTIKWISNLDSVKWEETLQDTLGNMDVLFDEDEIHIKVEDDDVTIKDKNGNILVHVDGDAESVDVDLKDIRALLDKYDIEYDEDIDEEEMEQKLREEIEKAVEESME